jgi:hypothetical protein
MKNNYIKIITSSKNELRTTMDINIDGQAYKNVNVKIDTGNEIQKAEKYS